MNFGQSLKLKFNSNPTKVLGATLLLVFAFLSLFDRTYSFVFYMLQEMAWVYAEADSIALIFVTLKLAITPIFGLVVGALGIIRLKEKLQLVLVAGFFTFVVPLFWLAQWVPSKSVQQWAVGYSDDPLSWVRLLLLVGAVALSAIGAKFAKLEPGEQIQELKSESVVPNATNPHLDNLPMYGLLSSFLSPISGIVLGHISIDLMNRGVIDKSRRAIAQASLVLGYALIGTGLIVLILFAISQI
jgi:hypothetical protein